MELNHRSDQYRASFNQPLVVEEMDYIKPAEFRHQQSEDEEEDEEDTETEPSHPTKHYLDPSNTTEDKYNDALKDS